MKSRFTNDDSGAVLVLALIFVTVVALIGGALVGFAGNSLAQTSSLDKDRTQSYAAEAAIQVAIQQLRTGATTSTNEAGYKSPASSCPNRTVSIPNDSGATSITVMCGFGPRQSLWQRNIMFAACPSPPSNCLSLGQDGFSPSPGPSAIVVAQVVFNDLKPGCTTHVDGQDTCFVAGDSVNVSDWDVGS
jgi:hypothetical protein